jgi:hypothetical protein
METFIELVQQEIALKAYRVPLENFLDILKCAAKRRILDIFSALYNEY